MSVQRSLQQESINTKIDDSPVTIADYAAQAIIAWILQKSCNGRCLLTFLLCLNVRRHDVYSVYICVMHSNSCQNRNRKRCTG